MRAYDERVDDRAPEDWEVETVLTGDRGRGRATERAERPAGEPPALPEVDPALYEVEGERARGGMGRVLEARDRRLGRTVALKELRADAGPGAPARFVREALITAGLQHPAIVPVYEAGRWPGGRPFYAMKLVEGRTLDALLREAPDLGARLALLPHLIAVADAVAYAHGRRVVHRDLKPANVLVGPFGETVVVDWGLARVLDASDDAVGEESCGAAPAGDPGRTIAGTVLGTPHFMAPEQARGLPVDERADVYALGAMLYFLLGGAPPHAGSSGREAVAAAAAGGVEPVATREPGAPPELAAIVGRAMATAPGDRYPSARELAADLRRFQTGQLVSVHAYSARELLGRFLRRHRAEVLVAAVLSLVVVAAVAAGFVGVRRQARLAEAERDRAERINDFLVDMLGSVDPRVAGGDVSVASMLDAASARVPEELGGEPAVMAEVLTTLGTTYQGLGLLAPATARLEDALAAARLAYGPEHIAVARALDRLAGAAEDEGEHREAERLEREALAMLQRLGAGGGAEAAQVTGNLARVLKWLGETGEAERRYREALAIQRRLPGDNRPLVAATLNNLGVLLGERGDWAGAAPLIREAVELVRAVRGSEHPEVAAGLSTLGAVLEESGDLAGAEASYRESLAMRERLLGPEHPDTARSLYALAGLQQAHGDPEGALESCRRILALRGEVLPDGHPMVAAAFHVTGLSLLDLGRPAAAEPALREALELRRGALPEGHWLVASSQGALGTALAALGRFAEAEALLLESERGLTAARGPGHVRSLEARRRLAALYEAWGRPEQAARWRAP